MARFFRVAAVAAFTATPVTSCVHPEAYAGRLQPWCSETYVNGPLFDYRPQVPAARVVLNDTSPDPWHVEGNLVIKLPTRTNYQPGHFFNSSNYYGTIAYAVFWGNIENSEIGQSLKVVHLIDQSLHPLFDFHGTFGDQDFELNLTTAEVSVPISLQVPDCTKKITHLSVVAIGHDVTRWEDGVMVALHCEDTDWFMCKKVTNRWFFCDSKRNCMWTKGDHNRCQKTNAVKMSGNDACAHTCGNCNSLNTWPYFWYYYYYCDDITYDTSSMNCNSHTPNDGMNRRRSVRDEDHCNHVDRRLGTNDIMFI